jgi:hypothetical protein
MARLTKEQKLEIAVNSVDEDQLFDICCAAEVAVQEAVAKNPHTNTFTLEYIANRCISDIRLLACLHPNANESMLTDLLGDSNEAVRKAARERLDEKE